MANNDFGDFSHPWQSIWFSEKVERAATAARNSKQSNVGTMAGNPLPTHIYFGRAAVAARWTKYPLDWTPWRNLMLN